MGTFALTSAPGREKLRMARPRRERASALAVLQRLEFWLDRRAQRRTLRSLDVEALKDIGLSGADAAREGERPFWRP